MAFDPATLLSGLGAIGGLFQKKKNPTITTAQGVVGQAMGAREAQRLHGVNFLTALGVSSPMQDSGGGPPPLASLSVFGDFLENKYGKDAKQRQEHNELQNDLLRLEVEKAKAVRPVAAPSAVQSMPGRSFAGPTPGVVRRADESDPAFVGPRKPVMVRNGLNGNWIYLDAGTADRARLEAGQTVIGEDNEAIFGDLVSEAINAGSLATGEAYGAGPIKDAPKPPPKRPISKTPNPTQNHLVPEDWWKQQF